MEDLNINWILNQKRLKQTCFLYILKMIRKLLVSEESSGKCGRMFTEYFLQYWLSTPPVSSKLAWDNPAGEPGVQERYCWGGFGARAVRLLLWTLHRLWRTSCQHLTPSPYFWDFVLVCSSLEAFIWWLKYFVARWKGSKVCRNTDFRLIYFQKCCMPHCSRKFSSYIQASEQHSYSW